MIRWGWNFPRWQMQYCLFPSGLLAMRYLKGQLLPGWRRAVAFISVYDTHLISINSKEYLSAP